MINDNHYNHRPPQYIVQVPNQCVNNTNYVNLGENTTANSCGVALVTMTNNNNNSFQPSPEYTMYNSNNNNNTNNFNYHQQQQQQQYGFQNTASQLSGANYTSINSSTYCTPNNFVQQQQQQNNYIYYSHQNLQHHQHHQQPQQIQFQKNGVTTAFINGVTPLHHPPFIQQQQQRIITAISSNPALSNSASAFSSSPSTATTMNDSNVSNHNYNSNNNNSGSSMKGGQRRRGGREGRSNLLNYYQPQPNVNNNHSNQGNQQGIIPVIVSYFSHQQTGHACHQHLNSNNNSSSGSMNNSCNQEPHNIPPQQQLIAIVPTPSSNNNSTIINSASSSSVVGYLNNSGTNNQSTNNSSVKTDNNSNNTSQNPQEESSVGSNNNAPVAQNNNNINNNSNRSQGSAPNALKATTFATSFIVGTLLRDITFYHAKINNVDARLPASKVHTSLTEFESCVAPLSIDIAQYFYKFQYFLQTEDSTCIAVLLLLRKYSFATGRPLTVYNIHRLLAAAVSVGAKLYSDNFYCTKAVATVGGLARAELQKLESALLVALNWDANVVDLNQVRLDVSVKDVRKQGPKKKDFEPGSGTGVELYRLAKKIVERKLKWICYGDDNEHDDRDEGEDDNHNNSDSNNNNNNSNVSDDRKQAQDQRAKMLVCPKSSNLIKLFSEEIMLDRPSAVPGSNDNNNAQENSRKNALPGQVNVSPQM